MGSVGSFHVNLGFKGWRAVWVKYSECKTSPTSILSPAKLNRVTFSLNHRDTIYIDLLDFADRLVFQTRDKIVPPFDPNYDSTSTSTSRQIYRWSQKQPTNLPETVNPSKTSSLNHIESRFKNFYCNEEKTSYDFTVFLRKRWETMTESFDKANIQYDRLTFNTLDGKRVISGPPLFCRNCKKGTRKYSGTEPTRKFSFVMQEIMMPLALEFHLRSRQGEIDRTVKRETLQLNNPDSSVVQRSLKRMVGNRPNRIEELDNYLKMQEKPYTAETVRHSLEYINKARLQKVINLLDYVEDQGWADGSGIGSIKGVINQGGAGFMHTLLFIKDSLHESSANKSRLLNLINTAKWYNNFGEVYQIPFEYNGTTADRMITTMLFRLMVVLLMPTSTVDEQKARQRDMEAVKRWIDNALTINKAFGGVVKPDYTGFHHMGFYASAYIPHALHTSAQLQYLLEGTDFALSHAAKQNLLGTLKTLRLIAVKYSTPNSVGGRFASLSNTVLVKILPAYAYISIARSESALTESPPSGISVPDLTPDAAMFLRLYQIPNRRITEYLNDGKIRGKKFYMNTLGSVDIMTQVS